MDFTFSLVKRLENKDFNKLPEEDKERYKNFAESIQKYFDVIIILVRFPDLTEK